MRLTKTKKSILVLLVTCGIVAAVFFSNTRHSETGAIALPLTNMKKSPVVSTSILYARQPKESKQGPKQQTKNVGAVTAVKTKPFTKTAVLPSNILNLANWKLTLPIDTPHAGSPDEIKQPELSSFSSPYFYAGKGGVVFNAPVGGTTTVNSTYPRSELREMSGRTSASWSNTVGTHTLVVRQAITHLPSVKPEVVAAQIHDATDDVVMVRLERNHLFVESAGVNIGTLSSNYALGTPYTVKIVAFNGQIQVFYNDVLKVNFAKAGSGYYFKAGCYTQSNVSKGEIPSAFGEVVIYGIAAAHN